MAHRHVTDHARGARPRQPLPDEGQHLVDRIGLSRARREGALARRRVARGHHQPHQQPSRRRLRREVIDARVEGREHGLEARRRLGEDRLEALAQALGEAPVHLPRQLLLRREVVEQRALVQAHAVGDLLQAEPLVAVLGEPLEGDVEDALARAVARRHEPS